jgi:hypothetical protein
MYGQPPHICRSLRRSRRIGSSRTRRERRASTASAGAEVGGQIFQEQREAKVSGQLTLNYKRVLYVLENCAENSCIARKTVQVYEDEDGQVTIRFQGRSLKFRAFPKEGPTGVTQGDIVANKHLVGALTRIHEQPQRREAERVEKLTTLRERRLAHAALD